MAYATPSQTPYWTANSIGPNKYGAPPNNSNRQALNEANSVSTQDYTGRNSPTLGATSANPDANAAADLNSPLTLSATAGLSTAIIIPPNAVSITITAAATFNFSEVGTPGAALTQYVSWPANTPLTIQTARLQRLLVSGSAISQVISFFFQIV